MFGHGQTSPRMAMMSTLMSIVPIVPQPEKKSTISQVSGSELLQVGERTIAQGFAFVPLFQRLLDLR